MKTNYKFIKDSTRYHWRTGEEIVTNINRYTLKYPKWYRHPKTLNEKKQTCGFQNDYRELRIRGERTWKMLPTSWDDINVTRTWGKSWKDYTKHKKQWMKKL